jgi:hypothetical protein
MELDGKICSVRCLISYFENVVPSALLMAVHQYKFVGLNVALLSYKAVGSRCCYALTFNVIQRYYNCCVHSCYQFR